MSDFAHVYVISDSNGWVKIGISTDPAARLKTLQCGNPAPLQIWFTQHKKRRADAEKIERLCHDFLADSRGSGEWFNCHPDLAVLVATAADMTPSEMRAFITKRGHNAQPLA